MLVKTSTSVYQWIIRSESGNGDVYYQDPRDGDCVGYNDIIFMQVTNYHNRWLTGARGGDNTNVATRNCRDGDYEESVISSFQWIVLATLGASATPSPPPSPFPTLF